MEIKSLEEFIINEIIPAVKGWDKLFLKDSQITRRWITSKIERKRANTTPCRLSKAAEEADSTVVLMREFLTTNKTKEPIMYLICEKVDEEIDEAMSIRDQLVDAKAEVDELKESLRKLQEQVKKQSSKASDKLTLPSSSFVSKQRDQILSEDDQEEISVKIEKSDIEVKSEPEDINSDSDENVRLVFYSINFSYTQHIDR